MTRRPWTQILARGIAEADVLVATGGVSVGAHDLVKDAFERAGEMQLWRVAIQPGKPLAFAVAKRADGSIVRLFGLPGNPVSSFVTFELFVRPMLRTLAGHGIGSGREIVRARLADGAPSTPGRRSFVRVTLRREESGDGLGGRAGGWPGIARAVGAGASGWPRSRAGGRPFAAGRRVRRRDPPWSLLMAFEPNPKRADRRRLTHVDRRGRPRMVDVSAKAGDARRAVAEAQVAVEQETLSLVIDGSGPKGDVPHGRRAGRRHGGQEDRRADPALPPVDASNT